MEMKLAGNQRREGPGMEPPVSPDHSSTQEVRAEGGRQQVQREETITFSCLSVNEKRRCGRPVKMSGTRSAERQLQSSKQRALRTSSILEKNRGKSVEEPRGPGIFFFIGGANGEEIVSRYCESRGWKRIHNKHREDFRLKWCEIKSSATYSSFREGKQLVYQIPNNAVLTTKIGLLSSLREYERVSSKVKHGQGRRRLKMETFIPTTFRMDVREEREAFFSQQDGLTVNEGCIWICKPTGLNQGRGIFLLRSQEDAAALRLNLQRVEDGQASKRPSRRQAQALIVQHYITNPLLLGGRKFDVRSYLLIACTAPYMVFFRHGYVRLTCDVYDLGSSNLSAHLTNQHVQKQNPQYGRLKEDTVWSMETFNAYVNDRFRVAKGLERDWVLGAFAKRMQKIMTQCFLAVKSKLDCRLGFFDLIGCDFMVDKDFKVWLLEMNCNPALHTNCGVLKEVIPSTVVETLDLTLEIFSKCRRGQALLPLDRQREFVLLYNGASTPGSALACSRITACKRHGQKTTNKSRKSKPRRSRRVALVSPGNHTNAPVRGDGRMLYKSGCSITSPLRRNSEGSLLHSSSSSSLQTTGGETSKDKSKLMKCALQRHSKATNDAKQTKTEAAVPADATPTARTQRREK